MAIFLDITQSHNTFHGVKHILQMLALMGLYVIFAGCSTESPVLEHDTTDENPSHQQDLYLSPFLILTKAYANQDLPGSQKWDYCITIGHWLNNPDEASFNGDVVDHQLVNSIKLIGQSKSNGLLYGQGFNPSTNNWQNMQPINIQPINPKTELLGFL
jgi:hypothetical protein